MASFVPVHLLISGTSCLRLDDAKLLASLLGKFSADQDSRDVVKAALEASSALAPVSEAVHSLGSLSAPARHIVVGAVAHLAGKLGHPVANGNSSDGPTTAELQKAIDDRKTELAAAAGEFAREKNTSVEAQIDAEVAALREQRQQKRAEQQKLVDELATISNRSASLRQLIDTEKANKRAKIQEAKEAISKEVESLDAALDETQKSADEQKSELAKLETELSEVKASSTTGSDSVLEAELMQLRSKKDEISAQLAEAKTTQESLRTQLAEAKSKLEGAKSVGESAAAEALSALHNEKTTLSGSISALEQETQTTESEVKNLQSKIEAEAKSLEDASSASQARQQDQVSRLTTEIEDLKAKAASHAATLENSKRTQAELKAKLDEVKSQQAAFSTAGAEGSSHLKELEQEKKALEESKSTATFELESVLTAVKELESSLDAASASLKAAQADAAEKSASQIKSLQDEIAALKESVAASASSAEVQRARRAELEGKVADVKATASASGNNSETSKLEEEKSNLTSQLAALSAEIGQLDASVAAAETSLASAHASVATEKSNLQNLQEQAASLKEEYNKARSDADAKKAHVQSASEEAGAASAESDALKSKVSTLQAAVDEMKKGIEDSQKIAKALDAEVASYSQGGSNAKLVDDLKRERQNLENEQISLQQRRDVVISSLEQTRARGEKERKEHDERLRAAQKENATARSNLSSLQTQLNKLESELAQATAVGSESSTSSGDEKHQAAVHAFQEQISAELALQKTLDGELKKAQGRVKQLDQQLISANERRKELNRAAKESSREIEAKSASQMTEIEKLRKDLQGKMRHTQQLRDDEAAATARVEDLRGRLKGQKDVARKLETHLQQLGIRRVELPKELDDEVTLLRRKLVASEKEVADAHSAVSSKQKQEFEIQKELTQLVNTTAYKSHVLESKKKGKYAAKSIHSP